VQSKFGSVRRWIAITEIMLPAMACSNTYHYNIYWDSIKTDIWHWIKKKVPLTRN
jgi:hypothetical protein